MPTLRLATDHTAYTLTAHLTPTGEAVLWYTLHPWGSHIVTRFYPLYRMAYYVDTGAWDHMAAFDLVEAYERQVKGDIR
jgi:hypothetical protein